MTALLESTSLFQPAIVPSSVAKSSLLGPELPPEEMTKPAVAFVAAPVGRETPPPGAGIVMAEEMARPVPS